MLNDYNGWSIRRERSYDLFQRFGAARGGSQSDYCFRALYLCMLSCRGRGVYSLGLVPADRSVILVLLRDVLFRLCR